MKIDAKNRRIPDKRPDPRPGPFESFFAGSKIVDSRGRPLAVYHGTKSAHFSKFELGRTSTNYSQLGSYQEKRLGIFFTPEKPYAQEFAGERGRLVTCHLSIKNPIDLRNGYPNTFYLKNRTMLYEQNIANMLPHEMWELFDHGFPGAIEFVEQLKQDGYDGVKMIERDKDGYDVEVIVALSSEQIWMPQTIDASAPLTQPVAACDTSDA